MPSLFCTLKTGHWIFPRFPQDSGTSRPGTLWNSVPVELSFGTLFRFSLWLSSRPISSCQLSTLLHLHPSPIHLVLSKGSFQDFSCMDISS